MAPRPSNHQRPAASSASRSLWGIKPGDHHTYHSFRDTPRELASTNDRVGTHLRPRKWDAGGHVWSSTVARTFEPVMTST